MDIIKVAGSSRTSAVAGAIAGVFREFHRAEVQAIGAGAVNQAVKALVLATSYLDKDGFRIAFIPEFSDVEIDGKIRTAIKMVVLEYHGPEPSPEASESEATGEPPDQAWGDPETLYEA
jgi:stage V sporulation protein S